MRVLYIDDDRINALLFVEACRLVDGVEVEAAGTGAEALEIASRWRPDLLVIDLHLPDTDGYRLLPALRTALQAPALPAFMCSADDASRVAEAARAAGFDGCWSKPIDLHAILAELRRRQNLGSPPAAPSPAP